MITSRFFSVLALSTLLTVTAANQAFAQTPVNATAGQLSAQLPVDGQGRHIDRRVVNLTAGQQIQITVASDEFDTMVRVFSPSNQLVTENDDGEDGTNSLATFTAAQTGAYRIEITSYRAGETGSYTLNVQNTAGNAPNAMPQQPQFPAQNPALNPAVVPNNNSNNGAQTLQGTLSNSDPTGSEGRHENSRVLQLGANEQVDLTLESSSFDTMIRVYGPDGVLQVENDDIESGNTNSQVNFTTSQAGAYRVVVTSYRAGETGPFTLNVQRQANTQTPCGPQGCPLPNTQPSADPNAQPNQPPTWVYNTQTGRFEQAPVNTAQFPQPIAPATNVNPNAGTGDVYGIFVGISDYGGSSNLEYTADDARHMAQAFQQRGIIRQGNAIVLTDREATSANVQRAFLTMGQRLTDRDTLVFLHDGHGDNNAISLRSGSMSGQQLGRLLDGVRGTQLVILDSCHSGSIAPIAQNSPRRLALLSSRASELSYVADEFRAGGYLAYFVTEAIRNGSVIGSDGAVRVRDLVSAVRQGYSRHVHGRQNLVVAGGDQLATLWQGPRQTTVAFRQ